MNDRKCLRTSTNVWRSLCDLYERMAYCIREPIRHTFATGETSITFETPQKRPRMHANSYECLAIICDHYECMANCIRKPIRHIFATVWDQHTSIVVLILLVMFSLLCCAYPEPPFRPPCVLTTDIKVVCNFYYRYRLSQCMFLSTLVKYSTLVRYFGVV